MKSDIKNFIMIDENLFKKKSFKNTYDLVLYRTK